MAVDRGTFVHIGIVCDDRREGEVWVEPTRVWVTNPRLSSHHVEWLRFEPDSPVTGPLRTEPHVAYRVADVEQAIAGHELLLAPVEIGGGFCRVAFVRIDGAVVEFMQYRNPDEEGWF